MKLKVILSSLFLPSFLCSCYASSYKATVLITDVHTESAYIHFDSFEGQYVFKLKKLSRGEGNVHFTGSLGEGKIKVSYVTFGKEYSLYTLNGGEKVDDKGIYIENGTKVPIIIKSDGKAINGTFTFEVSK